MALPRVLIIDADPGFRSRLALFLRKGFFVSVAVDGVEGLAKALEHPPELVVLHMPAQAREGLQSLRTFRGHLKTGGIPVVILSGDPRRETVMAAIQAGASDYILEFDLNLSNFEERIRRLLNTHDATPTVLSALPRIDGSESGRPLSQPVPEPHGLGERPEVQAIIDEWE